MTRPLDPCRWSVPEPGRRVVLTGALDVRAAADVRLLLAGQLEAGRDDLVLDLSGLTGLDLTGLGALVEAHRAAGRAGRVLVLDAVAPEVARLLHRTRLDRVLRHTAALPA